MSRRHVHEFTSLWTHFGPYGNQEVHVHTCHVEGCDVVLVGPGRNCKRTDPHDEQDLLAQGHTNAPRVPTKRRRSR